MKKPTLSEILNIVLIIALIFVSMCSRPKVEVTTGVQPYMIEYALKQQKERLIQQFEKKIQDEALKNIDDIDSLMRIKHIRDSLRSVAFR
jgi:hypothetical protein